MIKLLLVSPKTMQSKGGIAVWTDIFLENCEKHDISCDLLNIATIGSRAKLGNSKRNFIDEFVRTNNIFNNLNSMLEKQHYDVVHINTACGSFGLIRDYLVAIKIKKCQPNCKIVVHFHCDIEDQCCSKLARRVLSNFLKISDKVLVLNKRNWLFLNSFCQLEAEIVPNFIDNSIIRTIKKEVSSTINRAIFVGYVRPEKGIYEIYQLAKEFPKISFNLIGEIHEAVEKWDKPSNVFLCGKKAHEDILIELDKSDIFVFLSHSEGFSIALLESMARGLPCLATDVGANKEMLENQGGIIVQTGDIEAMNEAIYLLGNQGTRSDMSKWNINKVNSYYTVGKVIDSIKELYKC